MGDDSGFASNLPAILAANWLEMTTALAASWLVTMTEMEAEFKNYIHVSLFGYHLIQLFLKQF